MNGWVYSLYDGIERAGLSIGTRAFCEFGPSVALNGFRERDREKSDNGNYILKLQIVVTKYFIIEFL